MDILVNEKYYHRISLNCSVIYEQRSATLGGMSAGHIASRLGQLMANKSLDQVSLAKRAKLSQGYISRLVAGDERANPTLQALQAIADALGVRLWQLFVPGEPEAPAATLDGFALVPLLKTPIAAGKPLVVQPDPETDGQLAFTVGLTRKYPGAVCVHVGSREESMLPTITPGDTLMLDTRPEVRTHPEQGGIFAVNYALLDPGEQGAAIKRIEVLDGMLVVLSDNPDKRNYPTMVRSLRGINILQVLIGQVVWHGRYVTPRKPDPAKKPKAQKPEAEA